ncbi:hypothetical protein F2P81_013768 [Scophthalmus maximus]|uniref:Uncharacterized protein n=1 Tax=Scophthalmus maximus TaxID=52904 RepID=A0A6A4SUC4_SCOMX|nr:hypothetical protein F2P81_013768 [Scophthalmus maximus]
MTRITFKHYRHSHTLSNASQQQLRRGPLRTPQGGSEPLYQTASFHFRVGNGSILQNKSRIRCFGSYDIFCFFFFPKCRNK